MAIHFSFHFLGFGWERRSWKSLSIDTQEAEERGLEVQKEIFTGTRLRRKRGPGIKTADGTVSLERVLPWVRKEEESGFVEMQTRVKTV